MTSPAAEHRQCPTRPDGADPLIAHAIDVATCQGRQRSQYHKCYTCVHRNAGPASDHPAPLPPSLRAPTPIRRPHSQPQGRTPLALDRVARPDAAPMLAPPSVSTAPSAG